MTAVDSIKCQCANSGVTGQVGDFQNPGVFLQAFPSFLPYSLPALSVAPFFARFLTLVPRSLHRNQTETLAKQANTTAVCRTRGVAKSGHKCLKETPIFIFFCSHYGYEEKLPQQNSQLNGFHPAKEWVQ